MDRDGTIIEERHFLADPAEAVLIPGAWEAIRLLSEHGFFIVMVSNQSGVARGMFSEDAVRSVNDRVLKLLEDEGTHIDATYYCPHHPHGVLPQYARVCQCRKPAPGMGRRAAAEHGIDLSQSYMIGDKPSDVAFGENCGMKQSFLVSTGYGSGETLPTAYGITASDILHAAGMILQMDTKESVQ